jgi:hypothetical protein
MQIYHLEHDLTDEQLLADAARELKAANRELRRQIGDENVGLMGPAIDTKPLTAEVTMPYFPSGPTEDLTEDLQPGETFRKADGARWGHRKQRRRSMPSTDMTFGDGSPLRPLTDTPDNRLPMLGQARYVTVEADLGDDDEDGPRRRTAVFVDETGLYHDENGDENDRTGLFGAGHGEQDDPFQTRSDLRSARRTLYCRVCDTPLYSPDQYITGCELTEDFMSSGLPKPLTRPGVDGQSVNVCHCNGCIGRIRPQVPVRKYCGAACADGIEAAVKRADRREDGKRSRVTNPMFDALVAQDRRMRDAATAYKAGLLRGWDPVLAKLIPAPARVKPVPALPKPVAPISPWDIVITVVPAWLHKNARSRSIVIGDLPLTQVIEFWKPSRQWPTQAMPGMHYGSAGSHPMYWHWVDVRNPKARRSQPKLANWSADDLTAHWITGR